MYRGTKIQTLILKVVPLIILVIFITALIFQDSINLTPDRTIPENAVNIFMPLRNGPYLVVQNGPSGIYHQTPSQKYAMDIIKGIPILNLIPKQKLEDYPIYNDLIFSPCSGQVKSLIDGNIDNPPGFKSNTANSIVIDCDGFEVYMTHIKNGSFKVKIDQTVNSSDVLAQVGNSGNSTEPHLHISANLRDENDNTIPLPIVFGGKYYLKNDMIH